MTTMTDKEKAFYLKIQAYFHSRLTELKWIYSPFAFIDSKVTFNNLIKIQDLNKYPFLVLDRNIFSRLIRMIKEGKTVEGSSRDIAILITWAIYNNFDLLPYFALNEYAESVNSETEAQKEFNAFNRIFKDIPLFDWTCVALEQENELKHTVKLETSSFSEFTFSNESTDYLNNYAAILHLTTVLRTEKDSVVRFKKYFEWLYNSIKVSRFTVLYAVKIFLSDSNYRMPKKAFSTSLTNAMEGCKNQARDLSYLTCLSIDRIPEEYEPILVTDDNMLGNLYINGYYNTNPIRLFENSIKTHQSQVKVWVDELLQNHTEVESEDYHSYCKKIVEQEEKVLASTF